MLGDCSLHARFAPGVFVAVFGLGLALPATPAFAGGALCGDAVVEGDENCDDGNLSDLDGCTRTCRYEAIQRIELLELHGGNAPGFCAPVTNRLGDAFSALGLTVFNSTLQDATAGGAISVFLDLLGLDDAAGVSDPVIEVGLLGGVPDPADPDPTPFGIDAWYRVGDALLAQNGQPSQRITPGSVNAGVLAAGPNDVTMPFFGSTLALRTASLAATVGVTTSLPAPPPTNVAPGLLAFEALDGTSNATGLCGNLTVGSLATIPVPDEVTTGAQACRSDCASSRAYVSCGAGPVTTSCHSLLDILVGGCRVQSGLCFQVVLPTKPDVGVGANPPATLVFAPSGGGIDKVVVVEPNDAYSSWFAFATERVHATDNLGAFGDGFETGNLVRWSAVEPE